MCYLRKFPQDKHLGRETRLVSPLMLPVEVGERSGQMIEIVRSVCGTKLLMKRFDLRAVRQSKGRSDTEQEDEERNRKFGGEVVG
jgi:hypothetical protein